MKVVLERLTKIMLKLAEENKIIAQCYQENFNSGLDKLNYMVAINEQYGETLNIFGKLIDKKRELQDLGKGINHREIYKEIPPKVEYTLTELGESFIPVLQTMMVWSEQYLCPDYINPYLQD